MKANIASSANIIDKPRPEGDPDLLGIDVYTKALIKLIQRCQMPTTIGIQGEWGSGKTSMLNQIRYQLCESDSLMPEENKQKAFYGIWINTWQYSLMKTREETLTSILTGLTDEIVAIIKKKHENKTRDILNQVTGIFGKIVKTTVKATANAAGLDGNELVDAFQGSESKATLLTFKKTLTDAINKCLEEDRNQGNNNRGFLFFIDDLDRIDPPVAVEILELLKNIFEVDNCIFVLAIDYEVVVKGLIPKFGPLTEKNEREFRSFFDKIIQLPFSMPIGAYDISNFLLKSLQEISYITLQDAADEDKTDDLVEIVRKSVGTNPRSLKRLINTLSLINIIQNTKEAQEIFEQKDFYESLINFALVCIQIAYPKLYDFLVIESEFTAWDLDTAKKYNLPEINDIDSAQIESNELFEEEWEKVLYRFCSKDIFLKNKAYDISELLNKIEKIIIENKKEIASEISRILLMSAVTSVSVNINTPKTGLKRERYEGIEGVLIQLKEKGFSKEFTETIKIIHDTIHLRTNKWTEFSYGPNVLGFFTTKSKEGKKQSYSYNAYVKKKNMEGFDCSHPWQPKDYYESYFESFEEAFKGKKPPASSKYFGKTFWGRFMVHSLDKILIYNYHTKQFDEEIATFDDLIETFLVRFNDQTEETYQVPIQERSIWNDTKYFPSFK